MDHPSAQNYLAPIHRTGGGLNHFDYTSVKADDFTTVTVAS